ncbi:myb-like protein V isoform X2 [Stylophora pistillata]|uniref:myb-like protein V isoform X2 n=1 Tax=Stylophora pistillata TaxID=50429 RepID=UPI000C04B1E2|nr:myb-like protein V isoform X2 [Stylophora pistillata]
MAANESILSSWKTPFSTPIRKNENTCRDVFQNSEKLLASAVSICRLKGSVECQTGGLITVCEELQSLIRLAFCVKQLEKHFDSQRSNFEIEIACLKERVKHLEEVESHSKENGNYIGYGETTETAYDENLLWSKSNSRENDGNAEADDCHLSRTDNYTDYKYSDPNLFEPNSTNSKVVSVCDGVLSEPPEQQMSNVSTEAKKGNLNKCSEKLLPKKTDDTDDVERSHNLNLPSKIAEEKENEDVVAGEESEAVVLECEVKLKDISKKGKKKEGSPALLENSIKEAEALTSNINHQADSKNFKKGKGRSVFKDESEEVFQVESPGEVIFPATARKKSKEKKSRRSTVKEKLQRNKPSFTKKSKSVSDGVALGPGDDEIESQSEAKAESIEKKPGTSTACEVTSSKEKSSRRESTTSEDNDEPLGDMSFLININSQISMFVDDASQQECELQPMTARERNDVYKVTQLYKLRARIGTKTENNLTTVCLSKQADTRMPKPGRVDNLLSNLSIMASKEATRESPKNHGKRKHTSSKEENVQTTAGDLLEQAAPPMKKLTRLSKTGN